MKVRYLLDGKIGVGPSRLIYLQLQVFHTQSPGCSAQGHSKCEVSEFQTGKEKCKRKRLLLETKLPTLGTNSSQYVANYAILILVLSLLCH